MPYEYSPVGIWIRWTLANAVGELLGLGTVFVLGTLAFSTFGEPGSAVALMGYFVLVIMLAVFEGTVVGYAQWRVLRRALGGLSPRAWILATVTGAVIAWVLGMLPSTLGAFGDAASTPAPEPPLVVMILMSAAMGAVGGVVLAAVQWWVLRGHVRGAWLWLPANAAAWAVAMPLIFQLVGATIAERRTPGSLSLLVAGIGVAGAVVGAIHGIFLVRLLARRRSG